MNFRLETATVQRCQDLAHSVFHDLVREVITLSQIPAPTFAEQARGLYVKERMAAVGLQGVTIDEVGNVIGRLPGTGGGPVVLLAAHIDTVFPAETDLTVKVDGDILRGPGVGDNAASVAVMLWTAELLRRSETRLQGDVIFVATVGEEGLGDLQGIRAVMERFQHEVTYVVPLDGSLGGMVRQGLGSRRFRLAVTGEGGHSWGAFGASSAIHSIAKMIAAIADIRVPATPKTTFNVGMVSGGNSVNSIAAQAEALIDLRSLDQTELRRVEDRVRRIVHDTAIATSVRAQLDLIGDRPPGAIAEDHPLCDAVRAVHQKMGIQTRVYPSSTDGNIPLSMGIPSVTIGVTLGGNGHRLDEYIHAPPLARGLAQVLLLLRVLQSM